MIASSGKSRCVVVRQGGATAPEQTAAKELVEHLQQITGATFQLQEVTDAFAVPVVKPGAARGAAGRMPGARLPERAIIVGPESEGL